MLAFLGMLVPVTVPLVYSYAYDARGYGMVLGFSSAAVVCWDLTQKTRWRRVALLALPVCLAGAIRHSFVCHPGGRSVGYGGDRERDRATPGGLVGMGGSHGCLLGVLTSKPYRVAHSTRPRG